MQWPVTARQLEALVRLGEACARARLSPVVELRDAEVVVQIVEFCLKEVATDPESGKLDVDMVVANASHARRNKLTILLEIIRMQCDGGRAALWSDIKAEAVPTHMDERTYEETKDKLLREERVIYEPRVNLTVKVL